MVTVMEDNGGYGDLDSGMGSADGQWHHVAVTWASQTGHTHLYLDGRKVWPSAVLSCHVLRGAVLCCAVLSCSVLSGAVRHSAMAEVSVRGHSIAELAVPYCS